MLRKFLVFVLFLGWVDLSLCAQDVELGQVLVTPLKTESLNKYQSCNSSLLAGDDLEQGNSSGVLDVLRFTPGVDVVGGGSWSAASASVNIRGAQSRHTAYLFEGIQVFDASNTSAYYVPYDFSTDGIGRLEVVRFPLSSLYGSSPLGGVVNFEVKKPQCKPYVEFGSSISTNDVFQENLELGGKVNDISYLFNIKRIDAEDVFRARVKNNNPERDPYQDTSMVFGLNYDRFQDLSLGVNMRASHARSAQDDDDDLDGIPEDDPDNLSYNDEFINTVYLRKKINDYLDYQARGGFTLVYRKYFDDMENLDEYTRAWYKGETYQFANHFKIKPCDFLEILAGFDYTRQKADGYRYTYDYVWGPLFGGYEADMLKETDHTQGWFVESVVTLPNSLEVDFSWRRQKHNLFDSHTVLKGAFSYFFRDNLGVHFSYGRGFKAPSIYQLYSANGNSSLQPETSHSWEAGGTYKAGDDLSFDAVYFHSNFKNLIDFVYINPSLYQGSYLNAAKAKARGMEFKMTAWPWENIRCDAGYTYLSSYQDFVDDDFVTIFSHRRIRLPRHKAFFKIAYDLERFGVDFDFSYVGRRWDRIWVGSVDRFVVMKPYVLGNLNFRYNISDDFTVFAGVSNIFNKDYERIKGYQEEKASFYSGVRCVF